jgi:hypothetical protein
MKQLAVSRAIAGMVALTSVACGSYDESSGLIDLGGVGPVADVWINELMPQNSSTLADDAGDFDDWIEIYNADSYDVSLAGYFISDNASEPYRSTLSADAVVPAGGFLILWADGDADGGLHLGFRLSADGEGVWLTSPDGSLVDFVTFGPAGATDSSYSRYPDGGDASAGGEWRWCSSPTPGELNGENCG